MHEQTITDVIEKAQNIFRNSKAYTVSMFKETA